MASLHITRVKREFREVVSSEEVSHFFMHSAKRLTFSLLTVSVIFLFSLFQAQKSQIKIEIIDESDLTKLKGTVIGPPDTPFEGS